MSGFKTLGFLLFAPFLIGGLVIGIFGFGNYNLIIIPLIMIGEAILVLAEIIDLEKKEIEVGIKDELDDNDKII